MQKSVHSHKGSVNVDVHLGAFEITPQGRDKCILRGVTNLDPKFNWVPHKLLNWILKKVRRFLDGFIILKGTQQMIDKIVDGAKNFKVIWFMKIESKSEIG